LLANVDFRMCFVLSHISIVVGSLSSTEDGGHSALPHLRDNLHDVLRIIRNSIIMWRRDPLLCNGRETNETAAVARHFTEHVVSSPS
jgi:hypothetical protein